MQIGAYVLAGGRSSRMGRDKAMLQLDGRTLLGRAVDTLRGARTLVDGTRRTRVTIVGERKQLEGADRAIVDRWPGCGPLGGMETALADLEMESAEEWAFFLPVDMPLLTSELIDVLLLRWLEEIRSAVAPVRSCYVVVDGTAQPLVSLIHLGLRSTMTEALESGRYKVTPLLQSAGGCYSSDLQELLSENSSGRERPPGRSGRRTGIFDEAARGSAWAKETYLRFTNVNTEADLIEAATLLSGSG